MSQGQREEAVLEYAYVNELKKGENFDVQ